MLYQNTDTSLSTKSGDEPLIRGNPRVYLFAGYIWRETVVQLAQGSLEDEARGLMTVEKFLSIYCKVAGSVPVRGASEVRFEFGTATRFSFSSLTVQLEYQRVLVSLSELGVTCKANDHATVYATGSNASCGCGSSGCGPAVIELESNFELIAASSRL